MVACPLIFFFNTYSHKKCSVSKTPSKNKKLWAIYLWRKRTFVFCKTWINTWTMVFLQSKSTQTHDKSVLWGQSSGADDKADHTAWKSHSHSQDLTAKVSHRGSRGQQRSSSPSSATTFLMILVTTFPDNHFSFPSLCACAIYSGYTLHRVCWDFPAPIWYHH